jgi:hypothetical protein
MEWLWHNWLWIVLLVGGYYLISRMGMGCGMGNSHGHNHASGWHGNSAHNGARDHAAEKVKLFDPVQPTYAAGGNSNRQRSPGPRLLL